MYYRYTAIPNINEQQKCMSTLMKKILVTGSDGFLGSNLVNHLNKKNHNIIGLSNKRSNSKIPKIFGNVVTISNIRNLSCIVHLAGMTDIDYCQKHPTECFRTNVMGLQNMLEIARKNDSKFIFASSSQIFGNPSTLPVGENAEYQPLSVYAASKTCGEYICKSYSKAYGLDIVIVRLFSVYGPGSPSYSAVARIITQIIKNKKVRLGNLKPRRDFLYVSDAISAFELLINSNLRGISKFNIGSGESISIYNLCKKLIKISNSKIKIESNRNLFRKDEINNLVCDSSRIRKLGWKPKIPLEEGLERTYSWFKEELK